jgi:hypothetical protein
MSSPIKHVLDVLALLGELEWARVVGGDEPLRPPFVIWRFKQPDADTEVSLTRAVHAYSGAVEWAISKGERNWVIAPTGFSAYATNFRVDVEAIKRFGSEFPLQTRQALADAPRLAEYLRRTLVPN